MKGPIATLIVLGVLAGAGAAWVYFGVFNVAADEPHWRVTYWLMETARERSIAVRARGVEAPPALDDPQLLAMGAEHYAEMCTDCHLAPGMKDTEMRAGLYPRPPNLAEHGAHRPADETFWIIKHGVKMSGMPAWGVTHDDHSIWGMVALVRKLPELSAAQYEELVARGHGAGHAHDGERPDHAHADEPKPEEEPHEHTHGEESKPHSH